MFYLILFRWNSFKEDSFSAACGQTYFDAAALFMLFHVCFAI